tara:strand:+ start:434 stop:1477 length:1044 start_codon:yes stop_codon:yes gene_type:complete
MADYTTIDNPAKHFNTLLYSGNGSNPRTLTGVGFQPDWVWQKNRTDTNGHTLADAVRGANKTLSSDGTGAEVTDKSDGHLDAFTSDGFTVGAGSSSDARVNDGSHTYVAWNWLGANGTASNSDGSITATVSANQTAGFSIVSWTHDGGNSTIGHGLGVAPKMIITKERNSTGSWNTFHATTGNGHRLVLQGTNAKISTSVWNSTSPTSSVFSFNDGLTSTMIAYCFAEKQGYSKFGGWTGTGQSSGPFIYTGFRPAFLSWKMTSSTENWYIDDNKREPFNDDAMTVLYPNLSNADGALNDEIDLLSNGFKINGTNSAHNTDGATYIYWAFAEHPFVTSGTKAAGTAR